jgi:hypothetical protein
MGCGTSHERNSGHHPLARLHSDPALEAVYATPPSVALTPPISTEGPAPDDSIATLFEQIDRERKDMGDSDADSADEPGAFCMSLHFGARVARGKFRYGITEDPNQFAEPAGAYNDAIADCRDAVDLWMDDLPMFSRDRTAPVTRVAASLPSSLPGQGRRRSGSRHRRASAAAGPPQPQLPSQSLTPFGSSVRSDTSSNAARDPEEQRKRRSEAALRARARREHTPDVPALPHVQPASRSVDVAVVSSEQLRNSIGGTLETSASSDAGSDSDSGVHSDPDPTTILCVTGRRRVLVAILTHMASGFRFPLHEAIMAAHDRLIARALDASTTV